MSYTPAPQSAKISRLFCTRADGSTLHLRTAGPDGEAPVLLALHESPRSSVSLVPLMNAVSDRIRVIAPDTPGYGLSDKLACRAEDLSAYTSPLLELIDQLGLQKVALYGTHTGAAIAGKFALSHPERVSHLLLDGPSFFTPDEKRVFAEGYLPEYEPRWDGAHVMSLWSHVLDQSRWFPWHERTAANSISVRDPTVEQIDRTIIGQLQAGQGYSGAYWLAIANEDLAGIRQMQCPYSLLARSSDLLHPHLARLPDDIPGHSLPADGSDWGDFIVDRVVASDCGMAREPELQSPTRQFVQTDTGYVHARRYGTGAPPERAFLPMFLSGRLPPDEAWIIDPPGFGLSELNSAVALSSERIQASLAEAAAAFGVAPPPSAPLPPAATRLLVQPSLPAPALDGRHLLACWFAARNCLLLPGMRQAPSLQQVENLFRTLFLAPRHREVLQALANTNG